jgi:Terpene cyclase DEP1
MKFVYACLTVLGAVLPLSQFVPWLRDNGLNFPLFAQAAFGERIAAFAWLDVLVSAVVTAAFIVVEGRRTKVKPLWLPLLTLFTIGVSVGLPLFLWLRELRHEASRQSDSR